MKEPVVEYGLNDILYLSNGRQCIDFQTGYGSVILGHCNPALTEALKLQTDRIWIAGKYGNDRQDEATSRIRSFLTDAYPQVAFYSTGMEAIEFSLRIAAIRTGRNSFAGFANSVHGKSLAASSLCWTNPYGLANFHRLPFIDSVPEDALLEKIEDLFRSERIAAFYVEPIQGSAGGHEASPAFYRSLIDLCNSYGVTSVMDEILTGFFRAGHASYAISNGLHADIIVFGKCIGNGFPVSAVVMGNHIGIVPAMLPNSTYSSNPLACAVVSATLGEFARIDIAGKIRQIHATLTARLQVLAEKSFTVRGKGALCIITPPAGVKSAQIGMRLFDAGVATAYTDAHIRLLPPATIEQTNLERGLAQVVEICLNHA